MSKPRIKLKPYAGGPGSQASPAAAKTPPASNPGGPSQDSTDLARALARIEQLGEPIRMSVEQIQQDPHLAAARWEERGGGAVKQLVEAEQARSLAILRACMVTDGSWEVAAKLIENGMAVARASEYLFDVAAARDDGSHIFNGHSPEGGHRKAIDYDKIYERHNGRKEARS